ncbi:hypothetical protein [Aeoliella mucimassa]|uniref:Uncharacterized protein n=1 Tax=Aeoliella mucimassa TaxID=2527972 RepID=A0A518AWA3_9BACT|nr:hypothetical protein [Aeoliella mucimassa]QDU58998.1 hypothetical protein Pan181_52390 [Aeoliella mucimassa]
MQLDQTRIAIRERGFGEIMGLALQVIRAWFGWWFGLMLLGSVPFFFLNWLLTDNLLIEELEYEEGFGGYWTLLLLLVAIETPLATAFITIFMGKMMFGGEFRFREMVIDFIRSLPQLVLYQVVLRSVMMMIVLLPYWLMPYTGELILLERNPLFSGKKGRLTTNRRSRNLHTNNGGELFGRWTLATLTGGVMTLALGLGIQVVLVQIFGVELEAYHLHAFVYPAALWIVVGWLAVVRFLAYLDLRIRREGWEVELLMRAEASRLRRQSALVS